MQLARAITAAIAVCWTASLSPAQADTAPGTPEGPGVSPEADQLLRHMSDFLGKKKHFSVKVDATTEEVLKSGAKAQVQSAGMVYVKRPDELRIDKTGDDGSSQIVSNGKTFTIYSQRQNKYYTTTASPTLDATLSKVQDSSNVDLPGADLLFEDTYKELMEDTVSGESLGASVVQGVPTHHLVFQGREVDWQIWIEDGPQPLPRKYVITSKKIDGAPEYSVLLSDWKLEPKVEANWFEFKPPAGATPVSANAPGQTETPH
jgi:hypothetical protein